MKRVLLVLAAATASVVFVGCSQAGNCSPANCAGCCTSEGACVSGNTVAECGRQGAACTACASGQSCATNACLAAMGGGGGGGSMGGGGGTTGGGGGTTGGGTGGGSTGGGGGTTCATVDFTMNATDLGGAWFPPEDMNAGYHSGGVGKASATQGRYDYLGVELWYLQTPTVQFPYTVQLAGTTYGTCEGCVLLQMGCDIQGEQCMGGLYLAQRGTLTYTAATQNVDQGVFQGSGTNIEMVEWELSQTVDRARPNGRCVTVSYNMNATWEPQDAGMDAGMVDAGLDDGGLTDAGLDDAGIIDAGLELDAGVDAGLELDAGIDASVP